MPRDYKKENLYKSKPDQIKKRVLRNKARDKLSKTVKLKLEMVLL
jgi:hypothetical protein